MRSSRNFSSARLARASADVWNCTSRRSDGYTGGGQRPAVQVYVMLTEKTIDERIWSAVHEKRAMSCIVQLRS
jgi:hypothetical protein